MGTFTIWRPGGKTSVTGVNAVATGPGTIGIFNNTIFNASGFLLMGSSDKGGKIDIFRQHSIFVGARKWR